MRLAIASESSARGRLSTRVQGDLPVDSFKVGATR